MPDILSLTITENLHFICCRLAYSTTIGISTALSDDDAATNDTKEAIIPYLYTSVMKTDENGSQYTWTQLKETYETTVESELKTFNDQYHAYIKK